MSKITAEMRDKAIDHLNEMQSMALEIGSEGLFYFIGCKRLRDRYNNGERSIELYNAIMELC